MPSLLALFDSSLYSDNEAPEALLTKVMERLRSHLADRTESGFAYRVDFRLRPYGRASLLAHSLASISDYYREAASDWERQALLKLRPIAGDLQFGSNAIVELTAFLHGRGDPSHIGAGIRELRDAASARRSSIIKGVDIKSGEGGIRDVEFLVQGLQLIHLDKHPDILDQNTLSALQKLTARGVIEEQTSSLLRDGYVYLRRIEHFLQLLEDRQVHAVPTDPGALDALARRIEGKDEDREEFADRIAKTMTEIRSIYDELLPEAL